VDGPAGESEEENITLVDGGVPVTIPSASDFLFCYSVIDGKPRKIM